jgi:hypothetical protein
MSGCCNSTIRGPIPVDARISDRHLDKQFVARTETREPYEDALVGGVARSGSFASQPEATLGSICPISAARQRNDKASRRLTH